MALHDDIAKIASLIGDRSRAKILTLLMAGKSFTAGELAIGSNISAQTASNHLLKLADAGLIQCKPFGRYRYYSLASDKVASLLESLGIIAIEHTPGIAHHKNIDKGLCYARTCYDHLAGKLGVEYTRCLLQRNIIVKVDGSFDITSDGMMYFKDMGIDIDILKNKKRVFAKQCLDWTERELHIAGSLGAAILSYFLDDRLLIKSKNHQRILVITTKGKRWFANQK